MTAPIQKTCSRPSCPCPSRARGMCKNHYDVWRRSLPAALGQNDSNQEILDAMPGTLKELAAACQMEYDTVRKAVARLHATERAHITQVQPPERGQGHCWVAVFADGPGEDAKVPKWRKRRHARASCCARYAEQRGKEKIDPLVVALFAGRLPLNAEG
jgi:hypothetical protein